MSSNRSIIFYAYVDKKIYIYIHVTAVINLSALFFSFHTPFQGKISIKYRINKYFDQ